MSARPIETQMKHLIPRAMILALTPFLFLVTAMTAASAATPLVDAGWLSGKLVFTVLAEMDGLTGQWMRRATLAAAE